MKNTFKPRLALALALCGAVLPLTFAGCSGGNGLLGPRPQPTPTPTQPQPDIAPRALATQLNLTFGASGADETTFSQSSLGARGPGFPGQLTAVPGGGGTQVVDIQLPLGGGIPSSVNYRFKFASSADTSNPRPFTKNQIINITPDAGLYDLRIDQLRTGFLSGWRAVSGRITVTDVGPDALSFTLQDVRFVPRPETPRSGEFLANGNVSATGFTTGAPTTFREPIPSGRPSKFVPDFRLSASTGAAPDLSPVTSFGAAKGAQFFLRNVKEPAESQSIESFALTNYAGATPTALRPRREFRINLNSNLGATKQPFAPNQSIALSASDPTRQLSMTQVSASGTTKTYVSQSGSATVVAIGTDSLTLRFDNVQMRATDSSGFRLDGTLTGTEVLVLLLQQPPITVTDENGNPVPIF